MSDPADRQWFHDDDFDTPLPDDVSAAIVQFYGSGDVGANFAQMLAAFLADQGGTGWKMIPNTRPEYDSPAP